MLHLQALKTQLRSKQLCNRHFRAEKALKRLDMGKTSYNDFVLTQNAFLRLVGDANEFLRLIITNYMFKYTFGIKTTLESLRNQKSALEARFRQKYL